MKKIKKALLSILAAALILTCTTAVAVIALPADHTAETKEEPEIETSPKPLVINIPKEQFGKIIIYLDEEVLYEYEGPIKVERSAGSIKSKSIQEPVPASMITIITLQNGEVQIHEKRY